MRTTVAKVLSELFGSKGAVLRDAVEVEKHGNLDCAFCSVFHGTSASVALKALARKNAVWNAQQ